MLKQAYRSIRGHQDPLREPVGEPFWESFRHPFQTCAGVESV